MLNQKTELHLIKHLSQKLIGAANQNTNPPHILLQIEILIFLKRFLLAWHKKVFFFWIGHGTNKLTETHPKLKRYVWISLI